MSTGRSVDPDEPAGPAEGTDKPVGRTDKPVGRTDKPAGPAGAPGGAGAPAGDARGTERGWGEFTRAVHPPSAPVPTQTPLGLPVYRSAAFAFDSAAEFAELLEGSRSGYSYSRVDNPTSDAFAAAVAALEGHGLGTPVSGQAFASGMAAISTCLLALCRTGERIVAPTALYGNTYHLLRGVLARAGVSTTFVDYADPAALERAVAPGVRLVFAETLANPTMAVADLPALARLAHARGALLVVDSTFASPVVCRPLCHGADLVVHSATKYLGGHSDATGGVVVGAEEPMAAVRAARIDLGGILAPDEAFLLHRGLATLPLRVERACASAAWLAGELNAHAGVRRVDYPGLPMHPGHELATALFERGVAGTRYGAVVSVTVPGGRAGAAALCDHLRLIHVASSLGGTRSKVSPVATTTHRQLDDAALAAAGIDPGAVRLSVGLEDPADLLADLEGALAATAGDSAAAG